MTRILWLCILGSVVLAQDPSGQASLAALDADARQKTVTWNNLAQDMEASVARMLPCDPKVTATITAAGQASDARLAAVAAYQQAAERQASREVAGAQRLLASAQSLASELPVERSDVAQEQSGIGAQLSNLAESVKKRPALSGAQKVLQQIQALFAQRGTLAQGGLDRQEDFLAAVRSLASALQSRDAALKDAQVAFEAERARWNAYYSARLARSRTECSITRAPAAPPPARRPQGKQP